MKEIPRKRSVYLASFQYPNSSNGSGTRYQSLAPVCMTFSGPAVSSGCDSASQEAEAPCLTSTAAGVTATAAAATAPRSGRARRAPPR